MNKSLNCNPGNYQCGGICINNSRKCISEVEATGDSKAFAALVAKTVKDQLGAKSAKEGKVSDKQLAEWQANAQGQALLDRLNGHINWWANERGLNSALPAMTPDELLKVAKQLDFDKVRKDTSSDDLLDQIYDLRKLNAKPALVETEEDLPEGQRFFRGLGGNEEYAEAFRSGDKHYSGLGIYGNGSYIALKQDNKELAGAKDEAMSYNNGQREDGLLTGVISPDAKRITFEDAKEMQQALLAQLEAKASKTDHKELSNAYTLASDVGRVAALNGYDIIDVKRPNQSSDFGVLLNRGATTIAKRKQANKTLDGDRDRIESIEADLVNRENVQDLSKLLFGLNRLKRGMLEEPEKQELYALLKNNEVDV